MSDQLNTCTYCAWFSMIEYCIDYRVIKNHDQNRAPLGKHMF